mmetsp:Transcript_4052/g.4560  ORF Transcript_4052/g.4560 Transcript_4052/m.4560 type:complete len:562 (+) Transcript_4052:223-1908(+)
MGTNLDFTVPLNLLAQEVLPWQCSVCKKKFARKNKAKEHLKEHSKSASRESKSETQEKVGEASTAGRKKRVGQILSIGPPVSQYPAGARLFCPFEDCKRSQKGSEEFKNSPLNARPFKSVFEVRRHWCRTHTTERPFICDTCPGKKKFASALKSDLNEHKRICGRERLVWTCANVDCRTKCGTKKALVRHCANFKHELPNPLVGKPAASFPLYDPIRRPMQRSEVLRRLHETETFIGSKPCAPKRRRPVSTSLTPSIQGLSGNAKHKYDQSVTASKLWATGANHSAVSQVPSPLSMVSQSLPQQSMLRAVTNSIPRKSPTVLSGSNLFAYDMSQVASNALAPRTFSTVRILNGESNNMFPGAQLQVRPNLVTPQEGKLVSNPVVNGQRADQIRKKNVVSGSRLWAHETKLVAETNSGSTKNSDDESDSDVDTLGEEKSPDSKRSLSASKGSKENSDSDETTPVASATVIGGSRLYRHEHEAVAVASGKASVDSIMAERNRRRKERRKRHRRIEKVSNGSASVVPDHPQSDSAGEKPKPNSNSNNSNFAALEIAMSMTKGFT